MKGMLMPALITSDPPPLYLAQFTREHANMGLMLFRQEPSDAELADCLRNAGAQRAMVYRWGRHPTRTRSNWYYYRWLELDMSQSSERSVNGYESLPQ
jgi:hypothetical protein